LGFGCMTTPFEGVESRHGEHESRNRVVAVARRLSRRVLRRGRIFQGLRAGGILGALYESFIRDVREAT
jgi:hypothetical protein